MTIMIGMGSDIQERELLCGSVMASKTGLFEPRYLHAALFHSHKIAPPSFLDAKTGAYLLIN